MPNRSYAGFLIYVLFLLHYLLSTSKEFGLVESHSSFLMVQPMVCPPVWVIGHHVRTCLIAIYFILVLQGLSLMSSFLNLLPHPFFD